MPEKDYDPNSEVFEPVNWPSDATLIEDADEEIFILYCQLEGKESYCSDQTELRPGKSKRKSASEGARGLGVVDATSNNLSLTIEVKHDPSLSLELKAEGVISSRKNNKNSSPQSSVSSEITIDLFQDLTSLKSREGDTGSVVWRASVLLSQLTLSAKFANMSQQKILSLFKYNHLKRSRVLELGSGTGILARLISNLTLQWVATDQYSNIHLLQKNISSLSNNEPLKTKSNKQKIPSIRSQKKSLSMARSLSPMVNHCTPPTASVVPLDWTECSEVYRQFDRKCVDSDTRLKYAAEPFITETNSTTTANLILAVDCLFNEQLVEAFLHTLSLYSLDPGCQILIVSELRSSLVMTVFLSMWLELDRKNMYWLDKGYDGWEITRIQETALHPYLSNGKHVCWCGRRRPKNKSEKNS